MDELLPRPNNQPPISIRKSAFGRTNLFLSSNSTLFKEVKCSASTLARQATASIYHMHDTNHIDANVNENIEENKTKKNIVCWHCCHSFDTEGFRLPRSYDPSEKVYHVYGKFCSANCCKAYILEHSTFDRGYQMNVFVRMLREVYGIHNGIIEAPPRIALKMFGGPFDIDTFRTQQNVCYVVHPPFVSYCMLIEERQPIEAIGEKYGNQQSRGTVKGLRRPQPGSVRVSEDELASPNNAGLYSNFLSTKEAVVDEYNDDIVTSVVAKKQKTREKKNNISEKGLGRFMTSK
tara:strand:- start:279 stop:1151 length:873 start_codon:yes stop_codon:yes gene_type:complete